MFASFPDPASWPEVVELEQEAKESDLKQTRTCRFQISSAVGQVNPIKLSVEMLLRNWGISGRQSKPRVGSVGSSCASVRHPV